MLADKLEAFDNIRRSLPSGRRRHVMASEIVNDGRQVSFRNPERLPKREYYHQERVCADTGSSHSIAGERMFQMFNDKGLLFQETTLAMSLADGQQPQAKGNRTLLATYFLSSAGLVLEVKNTCWYFWDNPTHKYPFGKEWDNPPIVEKMSSNTCQLREGEGESLTSVCVCAQKEKLNLLLESFQNVFEPGRDATNISEHHINMGNSPPIIVPPYRMSHVKNCPDCIKYKASKQKPSGLLQTPVPAQRFETLAIDLFGPLPESKDGKRLIIIIEDCTTNWVELFSLPNATAKECVITLIEEVRLRHVIPRRLISDNGSQFVSEVMQQI
ncbi:pro-Pol polyprotein [Trichonephila clavipes]|nr:pro-Pol polyprotein [Trichonephila clavipes]